MIVDVFSANFAVSGGKFFKVISRDENGVETYRQLECYLPGAVGTLGDPIEKTQDRYLAEFEAGTREAKWALGTTGKPLTARYRIRESDGELVSVLALEGGMKKKG